MMPSHRELRAIRQKRAADAAKVPDKALVDLPKRSAIDAVLELAAYNLRTEATDAVTVECYYYGVHAYGVSDRMRVYLTAEEARIVAEEIAATYPVELVKGEFSPLLAYTNRDRATRYTLKINVLAALKDKP